MTQPRAELEKGAQSIETSRKGSSERLGRQRRVLRGHMCYRGPGLYPSSLVPRVMDSADTYELSRVQHYSRKCRNGDDPIPDHMGFAFSWWETVNK